MVAHRGGLPAVAWLGLALTSGCSKSAGTDADTGTDPIVGHWNLTERVMPDYTITYPDVRTYEDCTFTVQGSMDIDSDLSGEQTRLFRYECQGYPPDQYTYGYPLDVEVLEPSQLYRITLLDTGSSGSGGFDPGGGPGSSDGTEGAPPEEDDRKMDCALDGSKLECEEEFEVGSDDGFGDGTGDAPPPDEPTLEIHVWRFEKG